MKRHINALLQRKRADFDSAHNAVANLQRRGTETPERAERQVLVKDGYDWLQQIHQNRVRAVS